MTKYIVLLKDINLNISVKENETLKKILQKYNICRFPCGGKGKCGKCKVIIENAPPPNKIDIEKLSEEEIKKKYRLACNTHIDRDMQVSVPYESQVSHIKTDIKNKIDIKIKPSIKAKKITYKFPSAKNPESFTSLIQNNFKNKIVFSRYIVGLLPEYITREEKEFYAILKNTGKQIEIINITEDDNIYGLAIDFGTTTIIASLIDLKNGKDIITVSNTNNQKQYGDDLISRINYSLLSKDALKELQDIAVSDINSIINKMCDSLSINRERIYDIVFSGNTVMEHIFLGISLKSLSEVPFSACFNNDIVISAKELKLNTHPNAEVYMVPNLASFVGGDLTSGIISSEIFDKTDGYYLLIDIGTNGEVILGNKNHLLCASAAAGPAFEGVNITNGMAAQNGAIEKVCIKNESELKYNVIGDSKPIGICGSAVIDLAAILLKYNIIDYTGRFHTKEEIIKQKTVPGNLKERIVYKENNTYLSIYENGSKTIYFSQKDVRELQLNKSAIFTAIKLLLNEADLHERDIKKVYIAGGFGNYIEIDNAISIGLIPNFPLSKIDFIGNSSLKGSKYILLNKKYRDVAQSLPLKCRNIELASKKEFQDYFSDNILFSPNEK